MNLKSFKEDYVFTQYKDKPLINARVFKKMIREKYKNIDVDNLYIKIIIYQVKEYGESLDWI